MKTAPSHTSDHHDPSDEKEIKVTLTFNSLDEFLEHFSITKNKTENEPNPSEDKEQSGTGCGCYIALFITIVIIGLIIIISFCKIISFV